MKVSNGALIVMRSKRIIDDIYKLLRNIVVGDVASAESDNDVTKLWHMHLSISVSVG